MEKIDKFSKIEISLRVLLFLIFACSAILKLVVGVENFEMNLMESNSVDSWIQTIFIVNLTIIAEVSCALIALFGRFNWFQYSIIIFTFILYYVSISFNFTTTLYQDYTLIFFGFDIYHNNDVYFFGGFILNICLVVLANILVFILDKKVKSQLLKWPYHLGLTIVISSAILLLGTLNKDQFNLNSEKYQSGITSWTEFNAKISEKFPELKKGDWTVAFFSTGCDHCKKFARKISFTPGGGKNVLYVFWAEEEEILKFKKDNNVSGPHLRLSRQVIMNIAGQEFPVFFRFKEGIPTASYTGNDFTHAVIDDIFGN